MWPGLRAAGRGKESENRDVTAGNRLNLEVKYMN